RERPSPRPSPAGRGRRLADPDHRNNSLSPEGRGQVEGFGSIVVPLHYVRVETRTRHPDPLPPGEGGGLRIPIKKNPLSPEGRGQGEGFGSIAMPLLCGRDEMPVIPIF